MTGAAHSTEETSQRPTRYAPMRPRVAIAMAFLLTAACYLPAAAQSAADASGTGAGITVYGSGHSSAKPNIIEVELRSAAKAELTGDAIVKYRDAKRRTLAAFTGLKIENIEIEEQGLSIMPGNGAESMQMMWRGMANTTSKTQIELASTLIVRLKGIELLSPEDLTETIGKILDVAQDSGATVGPSAEETAMMGWSGRFKRNGIVKFILTDVTKVREQAYSKAVEDARERAERLARLNGVALGPVLAVEEVQVTGEEKYGNRTVMPWYMDSDDDNDSKDKSSTRIVSESLAAIPFRVRLTVRFGIRPAQDKPAEEKTGAE